MSAIFMINTNSTTVSAGSVIPSTVARRTGCAIMAADGMVMLRKPGYYKVSATVTATASTAGDVTIVMRKNGIDIPGITATETYTTADTQTKTLYLEGIVKVLCYEGVPVLTLVNASDGIDITTSNVAFTVLD